MALRKYQCVNARLESWQQQPPDRPGKCITCQTHRQPPGSLQERQTKRHQTACQDDQHGECKSERTRLPGCRHQSIRKAYHISGCEHTTGADGECDDLSAEQPAQLVQFMRPSKPCRKGSWHGSPDCTKDDSAAACKQGERYVPPGIPRTLEQIRPPPLAWQGAHIQLHLPLVRIPGSVHPALDHTPARGQRASCGRQTIQYQERDQARERNQTGPGGEDPDGQEPGRYADEATCQGSPLSRGWPGSLPHE